MAVILVAFMLVCSALWDRTLLADGQPCVDESRFKELLQFVGRREPPYRLQCPLEPAQTQNSPQIQLTWLKNCEPLRNQEGKTHLEFAAFSSEDQGNYTCAQQGNSTASYTVRLTVKVSCYLSPLKTQSLCVRLNRYTCKEAFSFSLPPESQCSKAPEFKPSGSQTKLWRNVGSTVKLNCTALLFLDRSEDRCDTSLQWSKDGQPLNNHTLHSLNTSSWSPGVDQLMVSSLLVITIRDLEDFGVYSCSVRNISTDFSLQNSNSPNHTVAVIAAAILLLFLGVAAVVYARCHLNIKLWYRNKYGDYELNDGKLYDAYISYVNNDYDRKFVNFILKPHLENKNGYRVHLNDNDILPGGEPSAELLMNMSRSRRLIVLLSHAYLEQDWCSGNFRQGLLHLLELCQQPILIMLDGQSKRMRPEIKQQLSEHQHCLTILTWRHNSVTPSSAFWKELALAMPRRVIFHNESAGDPQTFLQDDKDPMLTLDPDYLDCRSDADPAGDLGLRLPVYKALACTAPVLPAAPITAAEPKPSDIDVSDLGSRNYGARSDFYCLVTEDI